LNVNSCYENFIQDNKWGYSQGSLAWAVSSGSVRLVCELLEAGADPNSPDAIGRRPLHVCASLSRPHVGNTTTAIFSGALLAMIEALVYSGASVNAQTISGRTVVRCKI